MTGALDQKHWAVTALMSGVQMAIEICNSWDEASTAAKKATEDGWRLVVLREITTREEMDTAISQMERVEEWANEARGW